VARTLDSQTIPCYVRIRLSIGSTGCPYREDCSVPYTDCTGYQLRTVFFVWPDISIISDISVIQIVQETFERRGNPEVPIT